MLKPLTTDQQEGHDDISQSLEQCEVWLIQDPDVDKAKTYLLDALDEMHYLFTQLEL
jgi:hypothetical protein